MARWKERDSEIDIFTKRKRGRKREKRDDFTKRERGKEI